MANEIAGIRITPPSVEFIDAHAGVLHQRSIAVQNVGGRSKRMRFLDITESQLFELRFQDPEIPIAPGLEITATLDYFNESLVDSETNLYLQVDNSLVVIPCLAYAPQHRLQFDNKIDFGNIINNAKVVTKKLEIVNNGSLPGEYSIQYQGDQPISISPNSGSVTSLGKQTVRVDVVAKALGRFDEVAVVKIKNRPDEELRIVGNVVEHSLDVLDCGTEEVIECLQFKSAYYGTDRTEQVLLFNNGPDTVSFLSILDEGGEGEEAGTDLTQSTSSTLANKSVEKMRGTKNELSSLFTAYPNQGQLEPYEKRCISFRFSPRFQSELSGWKGNFIPPPRQDFAVFILFELIGSRNLVTEGSYLDNSSEGPTAELALKGTALPVLVNISPRMSYDFGALSMGDSANEECRLSNQSEGLSVYFRFKPIAHFSALPWQGKVKPKEELPLRIQFHPNQVGRFKVTQLIEILGPVSSPNPDKPLETVMQPIHTFYIPLYGQGKPVTILHKPVYVQGIHPIITNEVGLHTENAKRNQLAPYHPRNSVLNAPKTGQLHVLKEASIHSDKNTYTAFPNDRPVSTRPGIRGDTYTTIFTKQARYNYVDRDYSYTERERTAISLHTAKYQDYLDEKKLQRGKKSRYLDYQKFNNYTDIGLKPGAGLRPPHLDVRQLHEDINRIPPPKTILGKMLKTKDLIGIDTDAEGKSIAVGLNAIPITTIEKKDCSRILTPQEHRHVVIGPPSIEFGDVCLRSTNVKPLHIVNNLSHFVLVVVNVDCRELRQTSPLSQVVPPQSKASLDFIFESQLKGKFQRNVTYSINNHHMHHVIVNANVVPLNIELSTTDLIIKPTPGLPEGNGFREIVTLHNNRNFAADFSWSPIVGDFGTAFSVRPATGSVSPFQQLDCEVVFHPSFNAPDTGQFALSVYDGNVTKLNCVAKFGPTYVQFIDRRVLFESAPLNIATVRVAALQNQSQNHAYFQVLEPQPFPGLTISPIEGVVPIGGVAELNIVLHPTSVLKFDTRLMIAIRNWKTIELRISGRVELPVVEIDIPKFIFGGVMCGSQKITPFKMINKSVSKTEVAFDFSENDDFQVVCDQQMVASYSDSVSKHIYIINVEAKKSVDCKLMFTPKHVSGYDFIMPVTINAIKAPTPANTPFPATPSSSAGALHIITPRAKDFKIVTPRKRILATALRQPMQISHSKMYFNLSSRNLDLDNNGYSSKFKTTLLMNTSDRIVTWWIVPDETSCFKMCNSEGKQLPSNEVGKVLGVLQAGDSFTLGILFDPVKSGTFRCEIPVFLSFDEDPTENLYKSLQLFGSLDEPYIAFEPPYIELLPVPLHQRVSSRFNLVATGYYHNSPLSVTIPDIEIGNGQEMSLLTVDFLGNKIISASSDDDSKVVLPCQLTFRSQLPVSFNVEIQFSDDVGNTFSLPVTATADNCILTIYPYLAKYRNEYKVSTEQGLSLKGRKSQSKESLVVGEPMLMINDQVTAGNVPTRPSTSSTRSTSTFNPSTSTYDENVSSSSSVFSNSPQDDGVSHQNRQSIYSHTDGRLLGQKYHSIGDSIPQIETEETIFLSEVILAMQRWFSTHGWNSGPNPFIVPEGLRSSISPMQKPSADARIGEDGSPDMNSIRKDMKTVYEMVSYLSGRPIPGISPSNPLPGDSELKVKQLVKQHDTLLTYLKTQCAFLGNIKPEHLLDPQDFAIWSKMQNEPTDVIPLTGEAIDIEFPEKNFEIVSKKAWTDVLLQLYKVFLLAKVTMKTYKQTPLPQMGMLPPPVNPDPVCSNVYGVPERIILAWLNHHYEVERSRIWKVSQGGIPASRWIVNFDVDILDGLVIGACLGAYCPYLIDSHLSKMYTQPSTAEQCLHNALKITSALNIIGLDFHINAVDMTDPNPITLLTLCVHLFLRMPQYVPKVTVEFAGTLSASSKRHVKLTNPSQKPLVYTSVILGKDCCDFVVGRGGIITVNPRNHANLSVEFRSRFLRSSEAFLLLVGRRQVNNSAAGINMVFRLKSNTVEAQPMKVIKTTSSCYELHEVLLEVETPYKEAGEFSIKIIEKPFESTEQTKTSKSNKGTKSDGRNRSLTTPSTGQSKQRETVDSLMEDTPSKFYISKESVINLQPSTKSTLLIDFLPFAQGKYGCSVLFTNPDIGEILYNIESAVTQPVIKQSIEDYDQDIAQKVTITNGVFTFKADRGKQSKHELILLRNNPSKEKALVICAHQRMSEREYRRRDATGTLDSSSVRAAMAGNTTEVDQKKKQFHSAQLNSTEYKIELSSTRYFAPSVIFAPIGPEASKYIQIPITFYSDDIGTFPCLLTLKSQEDTRLFKLETKVSPEGTTAALEFSAPAHEEIVQNIPLVNNTSQDWILQAYVEGQCFNGPHSIQVPAGQSNHYALKFAPSFEGECNGKLKLINQTDQSENIFSLNGTGLKPLAQGNVSLRCKAFQTETVSVKVPNLSGRKQEFKVVSDISFIQGVENLSVFPGKEIEYVANVLPLKRGVFNGIISFLGSAEKERKKKLLDTGVASNKPYEVWFGIEVIVDPPPMEKSIEVICPALHKSSVEIPIKNPTNDIIVFKVDIIGEFLEGGDTLEIGGLQESVYVINYSPLINGEYKGEIIFTNEVVGEFWYGLDLKCISPPTSELPRETCELGQWKKINIPLHNPSFNEIQVIAKSSNPNNFPLELRPDVLILPPKQTTNVTLLFVPSCVGHGNHLSRISFISDMFGDWSFLATGVGTMPKPAPITSIVSNINGMSTVMVPFRNPMDDLVLVDINMVMDNRQSRIALNDSSSFCILLKKTKGLRLGPKAVLDVPVCFAPSEMIELKVDLVITIRPENDEPWVYDLSEESSESVEQLHELSWLFPIVGISEHQLEVQEKIFIQGQSGRTTKQLLFVSIYGLASTSARQDSSFVLCRCDSEGRILTKENGIEQQVMVTETNLVVSDVTYNIVSSSKIDMDYVSVELLRRGKEIDSGIDNFIFEVTFSPGSSMIQHVALVVKASTGGQWTFPFALKASEPDADSTVLIESLGLHKVSSIAINRSSIDSDPQAFTSYFLPGSDSAFTVAPQSGELLPSDEGGSELTVSFQPSMYGKDYKAKLMVQTDSEQTVYSVQGVIPEYVPPHGQAAKLPKTKLIAHNKRNFVKENLNLNCTASCSPVKGAALMLT